MIEKERKKKSGIQCIVLPKRTHLKANEPTKKRKSKEKYDVEYLKSAHKHSIYNQKEIMESDVCGCFSCKQIFQPNEIFNWCDEDNPKGSTALCPICYIDAVIGSKSGYPVDEQEFLSEMNKHWFS
jgi:hypothetical protein